MFRKSNLVSLGSLILLFCVLPGYVTATTIGGLAANELMPDPNDGGTNDFDTDGNGSSDTEDEFIEFYNGTGSPIDISGWQLYVSSSSTQVLRHTFPTTTTVPAMGWFTLINQWDDQMGTSPIPANWNEMDTGPSGILGNGGDSVILFDPNSGDYLSILYNGDSTVTAGLPAGATNLVGTVDFGSDIDAFSMQASPDGSMTNFVNNMTPTPGAQNVPEPAGYILALLTVGLIIVRRRK